MRCGDACFETLPLDVVLLERHGGGGQRRSRLSGNLAATVGGVDVAGRPRLDVLVVALHRAVVVKLHHGTPLRPVGGATGYACQGQLRTHERLELPKL